ncbi:MAG TPA: hypothetical protein VJ179_04085 [Patescibacteria group bacterium]|nr:hypothetical protein [Patescibacteria group bacterium]
MEIIRNIFSFLTQLASTMWQMVVASLTTLKSLFELLTAPIATGLFLLLAFFIFIRRSKKDVLWWFAAFVLIALLVQLIVGE